MENRTRMVLPIAGKIQHGEKRQNKVVELKRFIAKTQNETMQFLADRFNEKYPNCNRLKIRIFDEEPLYTRYARYNQSGIACYCKETEELAKQKNMEMFKISSVTGEGVDELLDFVSKTLKTLPKEELFEIEDRIVYTLEDEEKFTIERQDGMFIVKGKAVESLMRRVNIADNESLYYFHKCLKDLGVDEKLREMGVKEGDTVKILDYELEWE